MIGTLNSKPNLKLILVLPISDATCHVYDIDMLHRWPHEASQAGIFFFVGANRNSLIFKLRPLLLG
jgi:hypothetical protein